jgi:hypothetical protein
MKGMQRNFVVSMSAALAMLAALPAAAAIDFTDRTTQAGADQTPHRESYGASWGDLDGDGYPDLFVSNHWTPSSVFLNAGDGTFIDVARQVKAFVERPNADTHGGAWFDFNNDGTQDLVVAKGVGNPDLVLVNKRGMLVDEAAALGLQYREWASRLPMWMDYNGDGLADLVMVTTGSASSQGTLNKSTTPIQVLRQVKGQGFVPDSQTVDDQCIKQQYGQLLFDTDEGRLDFLCPNGAVFPRRLYNTLPSPWQVLTSLFPSTPVVPAFPAVPGVPGGADSAIADFDNDGRMDMFVLSGTEWRPSGAQINQDGSRLEAGLIGNDKGFAFKASGPVTFRISSNVFYETDLNTGWIHYGSNGASPPAITPVQGDADSYSSVFTLDPADSGVAGAPAGVGTAPPQVWVWYDPATENWNVQLKAKDEDSGEAFVSEVYVEVTGTGLNGVQMQGLWDTDKPQRPTLLMSRPGGFVDETAGWGLDDVVQCSSVVAGDFNNDMRQDLYLACRTAVSNTENILLENTGGAFARVAGAGGAGGPIGLAIGDGAGTADSVTTGDYDVDGFLDLFVTNGLNMFPKGHGGGNRLFHNDGNDNHWIELDLVGTKGTREAVGAVVKATATSGSDTVTQTLVKNGSYHRWSHDSTRMHFGLAQADKVDLTIQWPGGATETYPGVDSDRLYRATEGGSLVAETPGDALPYPCGTPWPADATGAQINDTVGKGLFLAKDCTSGAWQVFVTRGSGDGEAPNYTGRFASSSPVKITQIRPLQPRDSLVCDNAQACSADANSPQSSSEEIQFDLTPVSGIRAFTFQPAEVSNTCVTVDAPEGWREQWRRRHRRGQRRRR